MKRLWRAVTRTLTLIIILLSCAFGILCWQVDRWGRRDEARPVDAIVVLGAQVNPSGEAGSDLTSRTYRGVDLYNAGLSPRLICTGGFADDYMAAGAVARRFAIELGVPPASVFVADGAMTTSEDALVTAALCQEHGWRQVVLVSHPLHLYRARWSFRRAGLHVFTSPTTTDTDRIFPAIRAWYVVREAGALALTVLEDYGIVEGWLDAVRGWA